VSPERLRLLVLVDEVGDDVGGAERFAVGVAAALPRERFDVSLCATHSVGGQLAADLDRAGVRHFALGRSGRFDLFAFRRLTRFLRRERIQVLHSHKFGSNVWGALFGRLCRVPVIVAHEHTWSYEGHPMRKLIDGRFIGRLASAFVSVSEADRSRMVELEGVPARKAVTIPTAFVPRPNGGGGDLRGELGIPAGAEVVGTVAQLRPQKALEVLIEAFAGVLDARPGAHLVIVGNGPCLEELRTAAGAAGLGGRAHFPGLRNDLGAVLAGFDVAAMSSDFEGLPLFVFECMAHRTPLVATAVGGIPDVVRDGETGLLVSPRDPAALRAALVRLLEQPDLARTLASAASDQLPEYTMERAGERFAELYERLAAGR
jgi:glycosyltransferase involved in cell wall biosynthesis